MDLVYDAEVQFAVNLKRYREAAHLTQEALSQRSGVSTQQISRIETLKGSPTVRTVGALAKALQVEPKYLFAIDYDDEFVRYYLTKIEPQQKKVAEEDAS